MKREVLQNTTKRNHTVVTPNFFGEGVDLEAWQLGWDFDAKLEAKSSVSKNIFNFYICELSRNMVFYYVGDGNFYGIHTEENPTPVFTIHKDTSDPIIFNQIDGDTHKYEDELVLYWFEDDTQIWDTVRIDGKSLEEVLQHSYILVS